MKSLVLLFALFAAVHVNSKKLDFMEPYVVAKIPEDIHLLNAYANCLASRGYCVSPVDTEFRVAFRDAWETSCSQCSSRHRTQIRNLSNALIEHAPAHWSAVVKRFDGNGQYQDNFDRFLNSPN